MLHIGGCAVSQSGRWAVGGNNRTTPNRWMCRQIQSASAAGFVCDRDQAVRRASIEPAAGLGKENQTGSFSVSGLRGLTFPCQTSAVNQHGNRLPVAVRSGEHEPVAANGDPVGTPPWIARHLRAPIRDDRKLLETGRDRTRGEKTRFRRPERASPFEARTGSAPRNVPNSSSRALKVGLIGLRGMMVKAKPEKNEERDGEPREWLRRAIGRLRAHRRFGKQLDLSDLVSGPFPDEAHFQEIREGLAGLELDERAGENDFVDIIRPVDESINRHLVGRHLSFDRLGLRFRFLRRRIRKAETEIVKVIVRRFDDRRAPGRDRPG